MLILIKNNGGMVTLDSVWISCIVPVSVVRSITTPLLVVVVFVVVVEVPGA